MEKQHVFIDLGSDSEDDVVTRNTWKADSKVKNEEEETKPDIRNIPLDAAAKSSRKDGPAPRSEVVDGRSPKRIKTEHNVEALFAAHDSAPNKIVAAIEDFVRESLQGTGLEKDMCTLQTHVGTQETHVGILQTHVGISEPGSQSNETAGGLKPKAEPDTVAEFVCQGARDSRQQSPPKEAEASAEKDAKGHQSQSEFPKIREGHGPEKALDDILEDGEIAENEDDGLDSLAEEVQKHAELLKQKQAELESQIAPQESPGARARKCKAIVKATFGNESGERPNRANAARQFWHAGDYEVQAQVAPEFTSSMAHVRVHPKFLHSNATSHKWALGAIAELLDNAVDEVQNGATFVSIDMEPNPRKTAFGEPMLVVEDDGGGMAPDKLRMCMSLGYSAKSAMANTIGQYGNGFKTSTMRLGADVIVFTRSPAAAGKPATQSIGLLSFTFLKKTGHEDIVVPMVDFELLDKEAVRPILRGSADDHEENTRTICEWSPFADKAQLLDQFTSIGSHGTRVVIFNLWENDDGMLELDFESDPRDIQMRGGSKDDNLAKAALFSDSHVYLTYMHSLRTYASILYLELPRGFRMFLRGQEIEHHQLTSDMLHAKQMMYQPRLADNTTVVTTLGFWKDAPQMDTQGFNVYHKNRLIKPFWRVWNTSGSNGRGVIGVLEANFVEPAHDKQGFESSAVLQRLAAWLARSQKSYWNENCHLVGYQSKLKPKPDSSPATNGAQTPRGKQPSTATAAYVDFDSPGASRPPDLLSPGAAVSTAEEFASQQDSPSTNGDFAPQAGGLFAGAYGTPRNGTAASPRYKMQGGASSSGQEAHEERGENEAGDLLSQTLQERNKRLLECFLLQKMQEESQATDVEEVAKKDREIAELKEKLERQKSSGQLAEALAEKEARIELLEAQVEKGKETSRLMNMAVSKLKDMKALLDEKKATIKEQEGALADQQGRLEVAEKTVSDLREELRQAKHWTAAQEERDKRMKQDLERGQERIRSVQEELSKERTWNAERALQLVRMEKDLKSLSGGNDLARALEKERTARIALVSDLENERTARMRREESSKILARDHLILQEKHRAALREMETKQTRIDALEKRQEVEPSNPDPEPREEVEDSLGAKRAGEELGGSLRKAARRTSASSEVLGGVEENKAVASAAVGSPGDELRSEMLQLKAEMAQMKRALMSRDSG